MSAQGEGVASEKRLESGVFPKRDIAPIVRGLGAIVWDADGRRYVDCGATYGVMNVGHGNPRVLEAIARQSRELAYISQTYYTPARAAFLEALAETAPPGLTRAFLANSGTEAIEGAIKFARGTTGRTGLVAAKRAFHGRSLGALSLTWKPEYRAPFEPLIPGVGHVTFNDEEALKDAVTSETAALFLEPVQGEGGVYAATESYMKAARDITRDRGALLVFDEIQTGVARTGRFWACAHTDTSPDILCFAKSIAGGLPMGGLLLADHVRLATGSHGNTFGGSPLACAAATAVVRFALDDDLAGRAERAGAKLKKGLESLAATSPHVREVRGLGLMIGLELRQRNPPVLNALITNGVLALPTGATTIRLLPPLVITDAEIDEVLQATETSLHALDAPE